MSEPVETNDKAGIFNAILNSIFKGILPVILVYVFTTISLSVLILEFNIDLSEASKFISYMFIVIQFILFGIFTFLSVEIFKLKKYIKIDTKLSYKSVLLILGFSIGMLVIQFIFGFIMSWFEVGNGNEIVSQFNETPEYYLYLVPVMIFLVGPIEEIIFRGILFGSLKDYTNFYIALFISSLLFGLAHINAVGSIGIESVPYILITIIMGVILAIAYHISDNIIVPSFIHGIYNSILLIFQYLLLSI